MRKDSVILIGRGKSCLNSSEDFVKSHNKVAIINNVIFKGYEKYISNKAYYQFRNSSTKSFLENEIKKIELKEVIFTGEEHQKMKLPNYYNNLKILYPKPNLSKHVKNKYGIDLASGMRALIYLVDLNIYKEISLVGFDFYELGSNPYYFNINEVDDNLKYLWKNTYKNNIINVKSGHDEEMSIKILEKIINLNSEIKFNIITNNLKIKEGFKMINLNIL